MLKKIVKGSLAIVMAASLSFSFAQGSFAEEKIDGKCTVTIDKTKHTTIENGAKGTGKCAKHVIGTYGAKTYYVTGGSDRIVKNGDKYNITIMPGFYTYEVTVKIAGSVTVKTPTVSAINTVDTKVAGTTTAKAKVTVKSGSKTLGTATADSKGVYSVKIKKQKVGTKLKVTATKSKSSKSKIVLVKYIAPKVNTVKISSTAVKGTTVAGAKVTVKVGSKMLGTAIANKKGMYSVNIKSQKAGTKLKIVASKGKNKSEIQVVTVKK